MGNANKCSDSKIKISEIFYSLQGEGARCGEPSIFIRLSGCSVKHACYKSGVICDTEFESGKDWSVKDLKNFIDSQNKNCEWIVWSGGEPTDQLTEEIVEYFKPYKQAIECSGIKQPPYNLNWVVLSPKIAEHAILKKWITRRNTELHCDELRWVRKTGQDIPNTEIIAQKYYISPHFDGETLNEENVDYCIELCLKNPKWSLSMQQHKLWKVR